MISSMQRRIATVLVAAAGLACCGPGTAHAATPDAATPDAAASGRATSAPAAYVLAVEAPAQRVGRTTTAQVALDRPVTTAAGRCVARVADTSATRVPCMSKRVAKRANVTAP